MWGGSIIGFGEMHLKYDSGRELDWPKMAFSPRKQNLTLYLTMGGGLKHFEPILKKLGKYKTGKVCLYINKLTDIDTKALMEMIRKANELCRSKK